MTKKSYSKINLFIRALVPFIYSIIVVPPYSFVCIASLLLPLRYRHAIIRSYLQASIYLLKKVCLVDYKVEGLENIPKNHSAIILSKHQSTWETFFLPTIFHDPAIIVKRELLWIPFFGWGLAVLEPIAINRSKQTTAMQQIIQKGKKCLADGRHILIFPEGTRMSPGKVGKYKLGGGRLAEATGYPVIPVAHNAGYFWPKGKFIKKPGTIHIVIGPLIESKGRSADEIMRLAKTWIEETITRLDSTKI